MHNFGIGAILHADMDAFFVAVERREKPELIGKPVVVGGTGRRGVVAAASYEARTHGIFSAMPASEARRLCPKAVFVAGNYTRYQQVSRSIMAIFGEVTPLVEPLSLDEAFLNVAGAQRLLGSPLDIAVWVRSEVFERERLNCSIGVAATKSVAKLASAAAKPRLEGLKVHPGVGVRVVPSGTEAAFLRPLPIRALWGVGPKTALRFHRLGLTTVGDVANVSVETLCRVVGRSHGVQLHQLANGQDARRVEVGKAVKSISNEETFERDVFEKGDLQQVLVKLSVGVASRLRSQGLYARTVTIKLRFPDFETVTRAKTLPAATDTTATIQTTATALLNELDQSSGVRLLGVGVKGFADRTAQQLSFADLGESEPKHCEVDKAVDEIHRRFGDDSISPAVTLGQTIRQTPWGPNNEITEIRSVR